MAAVTQTVSLLSSVKEKYSTQQEQPEANVIRTRDFVLRTVSGIKS